MISHSSGGSNFNDEDGECSTDCDSVEEFLTSLLTQVEKKLLSEFAASKLPDVTPVSVLIRGKVYEDFERPRISLRLRHIFLGSFVETLAQTKSE